MIDYETNRAFALRLAREFAPERMIRFGSHAAGTPRTDSDVDLFVIMPFEGRPIRQSVEILRRLDPPFTKRGAPYDCAAKSEPRTAATEYRRGMTVRAI